MFPAPAIFCISAAALAYEILLMRLLSITQWHHFAYMIISLALLGFGASGSFLALAQRPLVERFTFAFAGSALLFGLTTVMGFVLGQCIPLNPLEILWEKEQLLYLLEFYLLLSLPFFFAANCIGLCFIRFKEQIHRVYLWDLLGAGTGALSVILLLFAFSPVDCLKILSTGGFLAAGLVLISTARRKSIAAGLALAACGFFLAFSWPHSWLDLHITQYKGLSVALRAPGARIISQHFSPLGWLAVVDSPAIPFRHAPGLSLNCALEPPAQLGVFVDGDSMTPIHRLDAANSSLAYLDCLSSALPYHLLRQPKVLVLGAGGGTDVLMGHYHKAGNIDAVELDGRMVQLVRQEYSDFAGHLYERPEVRVIVGEARGFVAGARERYDLIQVSLLDSFNTSAAGSHALSETYIYTVEALQEYFHHLRSGGFVAITRWLKVPPRDSLKLFATAVAALENLGVSDPGGSLALIRSWRTTTLLLKNGRISKEENEKIKAFCKTRSFDVDYMPGIREEETNRYNVLDQSYLYQGALALLGTDRIDFIDRYKFYIAPATDNRPYFFHFFKWKVLPEILSLKGSGGLSLIEWTYPILLVTLAQALVLSLLLILFPLRFLGPLQASGAQKLRVAAYFLSLGLAFMFIEMAFIQKFILFLSHPLYAVAVVLCAFLVFAGAGSSFSGRWRRRFGRQDAGGEGAPVALVVLGISGVAFLYVLLLPSVFSDCMDLPDLSRIAIAVILIAPLAFLMGMPFPLGLASVAVAAPRLIPWAWAINGCASVLSAVLATILAIHFGFNAVIGTALLFYILGAAMFWKPLSV